MSRCIWREGCDQTNIHARGLCSSHYERTRSDLTLRKLYAVRRLNGRPPPTVCDCSTPHTFYPVWGTPVCSGCHRPDADYILALRKGQS